MSVRDLFAFHASALPASARVAGFRGTEGLSKPYVFEVFLLLTNDEAQDVDLAGVVGSKATLIGDREDGRPPLVWSGILATLELVHAYAGRAVLRAVLVPSFWKLTLPYRSNVFTNQSVPDILSAVLAKNGITRVSFRLLGAYRPEEHVCQYRETDFDFVSRWMEREGMYYFFEQDEAGETLVITDTASSHVPLVGKPIRYFPQTGQDVSAGESFRTFACRHTTVPSSVRLYDYDYANPAVELLGKAAVSPLGQGEISIHGARFFTPSEGSRLARARAEGLLAGQTVYQGTGSALYLRAGYLFELEEHPLPAINAKYLATEVEHFGNQIGGAPELQRVTGLVWDEVYRAEVSAIPAGVQYRAPQRTPWPRIYGTEHAIVDGPATSEYAQIDDQGRYCIKLSFDESDLRGGKASTWVRMLQPHGGGTEGFHFPLRAGTEVMCVFLGGDPDRPVIAGVTPNALTPSPVTAGNRTTNVIQTGGRNRLELEDMAGSQRVTLSSPTENTMLRIGAPNDEHNLIMRTDGSGFLRTGTFLDVDAAAYRADKVGQYMTVDIGGYKTEAIKGTSALDVTGAVTRTYKATKTEKVESGLVDESYKEHTTKVALLRKAESTTQETTVHGTVDETYEGKHTTTVTAGGRTESVTGPYEQTMSEGWKVDVTGDVTHTSSGTWTLNGKGLHAVIEGDSSEETSGNSAEVIFGGKVEARFGGAFDFICGAKSEVIVGTKIDNLVGFKMENILGATMRLYFGLSYAMAPVEVEMITGVQIKDAFVEIGAGGFKFLSNGMHVAASGLHLFV